jgi:glycosyltransferase involved in cell wall biosynthesis
MRILVVSSRPPWPPVMADAMTTDRLIRYLVARGHTVDLACFVEDPASERILREGLGDVCAEILAVSLPRWRSYASTALTLPGKLPMQVRYYGSNDMSELIRKRVAEGRYDLVYTHLIRMAEHTRMLDVPKALGMQISQALNLRRMFDHSKDPLRKLFYWIESTKAEAYEASVGADFERVFLCGPSDIEAIEKTASIPNARVCPHGQDIPPLGRVRSAIREPGAIVVSGVMSTYTNVDAVSWFAEQIFPLIERAVPEAKFWIVGRNPQRQVRSLARPDKVIVTGEVPDVYDWLCRAQIAVAPLRIGAGMQNKVVQAMACELPVVATRVANEGIGATPDAELLLSNDEQSIAESVIRLLRSEHERETIGRAARSFVEANWTWDANFERLEAWLIEATQLAPGAASTEPAP